MSNIPERSTPQSVGTLRQVALLHGLSAAEKAKIERRVQYVTVPAKTTLMAPDEDCQAVSIILQGTVKVLTGSPGDGGILLALCGRGEILGEINAFDGQGHSATVVTVEPTLLARFDQQVFMELVRAMPLLLENLTRLIIRRLRFCTSRAHILATGDTKSRLARLLLALADQYDPGHDSSHTQSQSGEPFEIPLRLTQGDLADMIGTARPYLHDVLHVLTQQQAIALNPDHRITILQRDMLLRHCR
ncbi:MAG: Crp/Fnr family transcriptional regulator [Armatimonadota bacterium]|nr:Crp/Fnr family transcriptional regulator [Armatimonadota bacterium]